MTDALPTDWADALAERGVTRAEIAQAREIARRQTETAAHVPHDPMGAADPSAFLAVLRKAGL